MPPSWASTRRNHIAVPKTSNDSAEACRIVQTGLYMGASWAWKREIMLTYHGSKIKSDDVLESRAGMS